MKTLEWWPIGEKVSVRQAFGRVLCHLAGVRNDFVLFDADVGGGTGAKEFIEAFPQKVFQFGVAEQNMMAAAAGFSTTGIIPVVSTFAAFGLMRAHEQFRTAIAYPKRNVKLCCSHLGIDVGPDGATAQMLEDLAIARSIPNIAVVVPADANEFMLAFPQVLDWNGPVYMRIGRSPTPVLFDHSHAFRIGKGTLVRNGNDVTIVAAGVMLFRALIAHDLLKVKGYSARVINLSTIKPIDDEILTTAARETGAIVTAEDHNVMGGMGSAVAEVLAKKYPVPISFVGMQDSFGCSGEPDDLYSYFHMTAEDIAAAAQDVIERK
ncbi:MAG: transketolase C-terminal domain-containing protein [Candidatus Omnitrophota bacterium]